jgi:hypothetical protein
MMTFVLVFLTSTQECIEGGESIEGDSNLGIFWYKKVHPLFGVFTSIWDFKNNH